MTTLFARITVRLYEPEVDHDVDGDGRYVSEVDDDPNTRQRHLTYDLALFRVIKVLASYGGN